MARGLCGFGRVVARVVGVCAWVGILGVAGCADDKPTEVPYRVVHQYSVSSPEFERTIGHLLGPPLIGGNEVTTLVNGDEIFPPMLEAIGNAERTIDFETYIYWRGEIAEKFTKALCERAANGVKVNVILDPVGSDKIDKSYITRMERCGVQIVQFHHLKWYDWTSAQKLNSRTHRKLLVVDGVVGFTGGVGIADEWKGNADSPEHWRDTHYMVKGPAVAEMQAAFADNWMGSTGRVIHGDEYFPVIKDAGEQWAQVFKSGPQGGSESMELLYLLSIAASEKSIRLATPYFVPDDLTIQALTEARKRGVTVRIILPGGKMDVEIVRHASRDRWGKLLEAGVEIYEYQPTMYHCKQMIVDDNWVSIGSANLDNRSFRMNSEANLNVMDHAFAVGQIRVFDEDLEKCKQVKYDEWKKRAGQEKLMGVLAGAFGWLM